METNIIIGIGTFSLGVIVMLVILILARKTLKENNNFRK